mgnify:CR=1 FL=1
MKDFVLIPQTGRQIPLQYISFNPITNHFFYQGIDVSDWMYRDQKLFIAPNFDVERENMEAFERHWQTEHPGVPVPYSNDDEYTEFFWQFMNGVGDDLESGKKVIGEVVSTTATGLAKLPGAVANNLGLILLVGIAGYFLFLSDKHQTFGKTFTRN